MHHFHDVMYRLSEVLRNSAYADAFADFEPDWEFILQKNRSHDKAEASSSADREITSGTVGNTSVIATVGVEGIGKTTFAEIVYHDNRVKASFELRGWVDYQEGIDAKRWATESHSLMKKGCHGLNH
ncbi:hypothetical protein AAHE18_13G114800 [Arachis hypogaea]